MDSSSTDKATDNKETTNTNSKAGQSKTPSKKLRDKLRFLSFRKKKETPKQETQERERVVEPEQFSYKNIEYGMKLTRLEDPTILIIALRHYTRITHPKGNTITFPVPEAFDRIQLKCANLPTDVEELGELMKKVFHRRDEKLDIEELYNDFVKTHGRITFDHTQKWPHSQIHTRHP